MHWCLLTGFQTPKVCLLYFLCLVFWHECWAYCCSSYKNWSIGRLICFQMLPAIFIYRGSSRKEMISLFRCSYKLGVLLLPNHRFFLIVHMILVHVFYQNMLLCITYVLSFPPPHLGCTFWSSTIKFYAKPVPRQHD